MYLVPIQVPIYLDGPRKLVTAEWHRSLFLLRDSFNGRFGEITVAAPSLPASIASPEQPLIEITDANEGVRLFPSFDKRCRMRSYWRRERKQWKADLRELTSQASVVHAGVDDVYRPISFEGFRTGVKMDKPTVFVQDTDNVVQQTQLFADKPWRQRKQTAIYTWIYERMCRWAVARADLCLLKGSSLIERYGAYAKNAHEFHDTSYSVTDIITFGDLDRRVETLNKIRPLRLVYCGRLHPRKGLDRSLKIIAAARGFGADIEFDIIGDGSERANLEKQARDDGIADFIRFHGAATYNPELLRRLSRFDALLFTPTAEDTPRMIFDGYAAGLPLVAFDIGYVRERAAREKATYLLPRHRITEAAERLATLCRERLELASLSKAARNAADYHASENWYRRRAEWTIEAVVRHHTGMQPVAGAISAGETP
jgi:glycosyltransferase involved in cell wall biosynthesis